MSLFNLKYIAIILGSNEESRMALSVTGMMALHSPAELSFLHIVQYRADFAGVMPAGQPTYHRRFIDAANEKLLWKDFQSGVERALPQGISFLIRRLYATRIQDISDDRENCYAGI